MRLHMIAALANNGTIGRDGDLPWHLPADLAHFKRTTSGHCVIMGRKTHESIGRALPRRINIILTQNTKYQAQGCKVVHTIDDAIAVAQSTGESDAFVIGGAAIYRSFFFRAHELHLTRVDTDIEGDAIFPDFPEEDWELLSSESFPPDEKNQHTMVFEHLIRPVASGTTT